MTTQKINTDFDSADNLEQIIQFDPQKETLFLPLWCEGKMLLSPVENWQLVDKRWNVPLCDKNEAKNCLLSAQKNLTTWSNQTWRERLNCLIKWLDLLNKDLYARHFEKNFFADPDRKHLLNFFIESLRQQINMCLNISFYNTDGKEEKICGTENDILCLVLNNADYEGGEERFFRDFAKILVQQVFILGKTLILKPAPNLSPLVLALAELTSRTEPNFLEGVVNVLHGNGEIIKDICQGFSEENQASKTKLWFGFISNEELKQNYLKFLNDENNCCKNNIFIIE